MEFAASSNSMLSQWSADGVESRKERLSHKQALEGPTTGSCYANTAQRFSPGNPHVRFDEGQQANSVACCPTLLANPFSATEL